MTFRTYATLHRLGLIKQESEDELKKAPCPATLCGKPVPKNLNELTMDQLTDLMSINADTELDTFRVILGIDPRQLAKQPAVDVVGTANFFQKELEKITDLFDQLKPHYSKEEREAGIEQLNHGIFGTIDWYARRMGISDHDEVLKVQWIKVWQCAKIDKENNEYDKRYREVVANQNK